METLYPRLVLDALSTVRYPGNGKDIVSFGMVEDDMRIDGKKVEFSLIFDKPTDPFIKSIVKAAETAILTHISPEVDIKGNISVKTRQQMPAQAEHVNPLPGVKNIIGISSGKGGVGKSTVASNLAVALAREGYKVGLLDADIFGPSMPKMFGVEKEPLYIHKVDGRDLIIPVERYGVKLLSIGFVIDPDSAAVWRGSMASNALKQLITDADWGELDYFLIDMPPGTSDIHLTLVQTLAISGIVIVSTPQEVALADARKGISMFTGEKINVPVLGIVENMAWFTPEAHPEERYYIFGRDGATRLAKDMDVPLLAQIPVVGRICDRGDSGEPIALDDSVTSMAFMHLAHEVIEAVDKRNNELPPTLKVNVTRK
jgi:ATP-binding protein involved in chromosome partitioning